MKKIIFTILIALVLSSCAKEEVIIIRKKKSLTTPQKGLCFFRLRNEGCEQYFKEKS